MDYTFKNGIYLEIQYVHNFFIKRGRENLNDYLIVIAEKLSRFGYGTGLNFSYLQNKIAPGGRIIGVDLTDAMVERAQFRLSRQKWSNVD